MSIYLRELGLDPDPDMINLTLTKSDVVEACDFAKDLYITTCSHIDYDTDISKHFSTLKFYKEMLDIMSTILEDMEEGNFKYIHIA